MAAESFKEQQQLLAAWGDDLPGQVRNSLGQLNPRTISGERHGSWFLRLEWSTSGLTRLVEVALTNPELTPDSATTSAVVSVRAAATTDERFVSETLFESRRSLARLQPDALADQLAAAIQRSRSYTNTNLVSTYVTGTDQFLNG
ncbi:hypothetical protein [Nocardioides baculatus]|uniref:Uncharacterized protein n=1 Tax=Nocardioides baculatus TaxID=2801337 RepID=A0ABS1LCR1_9ACTN|nr:hypothetical protein [Nocardioides baculatus]MBL0749475.1 hypothetical protein [Nocardioides baculatus]